MAKDKEFEKIYKEIGRRRAFARRRDRNYRHWRNKHNRGKVCPDCGGMMTWCTICDVWSKYCCDDYGSCACS